MNQLHMAVVFAKLQCNQSKLTNEEDEELATIRDDGIGII